MLHQILISVLYFLLRVNLIFSCRSDNVLEVDTTRDHIPFATRAHWMRAANQALDSPCPFYAFGTVIVNHTGHGLGQLVCTGSNKISATGNPSQHGEMVAIANCTSILTSNGLSPNEIRSAFTELSLYTNGEACPMCASAIRLTGFKEYIFGSSSRTLVPNGFNQILIYSKEVFAASTLLPTTTKYIPGILSNETDPLFMWQTNPNYPCPTGCERNVFGSNCAPILN